MSESQLAALLWGGFAVVFGTLLVIFRYRVSEEAARRHGPSQTPAVFGVGGAFFAVAGVASVIAGLTGIVN